MMRGEWPGHSRLCVKHTRGLGAMQLQSQFAEKAAQTMRPCPHACPLSGHAQLKYTLHMALKESSSHRILALP